MGNLCCKKKRRPTESSSESEVKKENLPTAKAVDEVEVAIEVQVEDPETFYGKFDFPIFVGQSIEDVQLLERAETSEDRILDLLLIMDCTSSMSSWLRLCRRTLKESISILKDENPDLQVRVAFLGYRDIGDKNNIFVIQDFTFDLERVKDLISETPARGGADVPEDIQGALYQGLKLSWRDVSVKICYLCTDAPCHGKKYHSLRDHYPEGNPAGLILEDQMVEYSNKEIDLTVYHLTGQTKNMYDMMEEAYDQGKNKGQMARIVLEKEIKVAKSKPKPFSSPPISTTTESKTKSKRSRRNSEDYDLFEMESLYATNFQNDLRHRAKVQYARHGWSKKSKF